MSVEKTVVFGDRHAFSGHTAAVYRYYDAMGVDKYVSVGDTIDKGPDSCGVMEQDKAHNTTSVLGNHEWIQRGVFSYPDPELRSEIRSALWMTKGFTRRYERNMLSSYGIEELIDPNEAASRLEDKMRQLGHLALLEASPLYFEADEFIVIHAGLSKVGWNKQKAELDELLRRGNSEGLFGDMPEQLGGFSYDLAVQEEAFGVTDKIVINGHAHLKGLGPNDRVTAQGKRVRLASNIEGGEPLYVWESWTGHVRGFLPEGLVT